MGTVYSNSDDINKTQVVWKWEHGHNEFRPYCPSISSLIEKYYRSGSTTILHVKAINQITYQIDLKELVQINPTTKVKRKILREIQRDTSYTIRWSWENDAHEMQFYPSEISEKIEAQYIRGYQAPIKVSLFQRQYIIDPVKKTQISISSKKKRRIERYTIPGHKSIWQWQHDDGEFINYIDEDVNRIERHYLSKAKEPFQLFINGANYEIDLAKMLQVNSNTTRYNQIRRVEENYVRYGWFWKDEDGRWNPFGLYFIEKLEMNYKSPSQSPLAVTMNGSQFEIDTKGMIKLSIVSGTQYQLKREALSNDRAAWLWLSKKGAMKALPAYTFHMLETQYMLNDSTPIIFEWRGKNYKLDVTKMERVNMQTKTVRQLKRRVVPNNYPSEFELISKSQCKEVFKYLCNVGYLPTDWDCEHQEGRLDVLPVTDIERNMLVGRFEFSEFDVLEVLRVQNQPLINYFLLERMNIRNFLHGADEPTLLFYLSDKDQRPEDIYDAMECGLLNRYSPNKEYGKAFYFTRSPKLADQHAYCKEETGTKVLICFWVLLGRIASINCNEDQKNFYKGKYNKLADIQKEPPECDSISGMIGQEEVYVLYRPERCYPLYTMEYTELNSY